MGLLKSRMMVSVVGSELGSGGDVGDVGDGEKRKSNFCRGEVGLKCSGQEIRIFFAMGQCSFFPSGSIVLSLHVMVEMKGCPCLLLASALTTNQGLWRPGDGRLFPWEGKNNGSNLDCPVDAFDPGSDLSGNGHCRVMLSQERDLWQGVSWCKWPGRTSGLQQDHGIGRFLRQVGHGEDRSGTPSMCLLYRRLLRFCITNT
jgi:hypothetical protein